MFKFMRQNLTFYFLKWIYIIKENQLLIIFIYWIILNYWLSIATTILLVEISYEYIDSFESNTYTT